MPQQDDALFAAIARNDPAGVEAAIGAGADLNARRGYNHTALSRAVAKDSARLAGLLLERGADPNARSESGETSLHHARLASREVFDRLIAAAADPNAADKLGQTPLHLAVSDPDSDSLERFERVDRLINAGADTNARTNRQETPLHRAALSLRDSAPTIRQLLDAGADPKARDELGNTALHCAAGKSSVDRACAVDHLLRSGTGLHARNLAGATPLHFAAAGDGDGQAKTMTRLLSEHPDLTIRNAEGKTPPDVSISPTAKEIFARRWPAAAGRQQEKQDVKRQPEKNTPRKPDRTEEYHRQFADQIIQQIRQGTAPWQKPWKPGEGVLPSNIDTGRPYAGGNSLHLAAVVQARGYADVRWGTYRQIQALGGQLRKGEQGTRILSFQDHKRIAVTDERGQPVTDSEGKRVYRYERLAVPWVKQYTVFNAEQADGLPARPTPTAEPLWKAHQKAEVVLQSNGVPIRHVAGDRAHYNLNHDEIVLPERGQFPSANHYYQTALHELGHGTGHPDRMNRASLIEGVKAGFGSAAYAKKELRAEISAMMTGERVRVGHDPSRGAAYVESWVAVLKEDPREIRRAAADAWKISDFVIERSREREAEREPTEVTATRSAASPQAAMQPQHKLPVPERSFGPSR